MSGISFKEDLLEFFDDITPKGVKKIGWENYVKGGIDFDEYEFESANVQVNFVSSIQGIHQEEKMKKQGLCRV